MGTSGQPGNDDIPTGAPQSLGAAAQVVGANVAGPNNLKGRTVPNDKGSSIGVNAAAAASEANSKSKGDSKVAASSGQASGAADKSGGAQAAASGNAKQTTQKKS